MSDTSVMPVWQIVILVIGAVGGLGGIAALGTMWLGWRRAKPDIARLYEEMSTKQAEQIKDLRHRTDRQDTKIQKLTATMRDWLIGIKALIQQLCELNQEPVWMPQDCDKLLEDDEDASR